MRKIFNLLALGLAIAGICLKLNGFNGADIVIVVSAVTMILSLVMFALNDNKEAGLSNWLNYFLVGIVTLFIIGSIMKFMHWPGSALVLIASFGLLPISLIGLIFQRDEAKVSRQFFITFSTFFILLIGVFSSNLFECGSCMKDKCSMEQGKNEHCKKGMGDKEHCKMMDQCKMGEGKCKEMGMCKMGDGSKSCCKKGTSEEGKCKMMENCKMEEGKKDCCKKGMADEGHCKKGDAKKACCKEDKKHCSEKEKAACKH